MFGCSLPNCCWNVRFRGTLAPGNESDKSLDESRIDSPRLHQRRLCLHFGAAPAGKCFVGLALQDYDVVFADVIPGIIRDLRIKKNYPLQIIDSSNTRQVTVPVLDAVFANSKSCIAYITECDIITTTVGDRVLPRLAPTILVGLLHRQAAHNENPLNILCCESFARATSSLKEYIFNLNITNDTRTWIESHVGFVDCNVDRVLLSTSDSVLSVYAQYEWNASRSQLKGGLPLTPCMTLTDDIPLVPAERLIEGSGLRTQIMAPSVLLPPTIGASSA
eukprot:Gregarina_sp_Poly_1__8563@NODE_507_length_7855_cov_144_722779_g405_i0_p4_GENE_NODE_507_length_7855_cov_144_722779_g405_i0NODE_507_length_7855_cov_144_722779_g405_i0_p4_ORF_typecomplete_len277_score18_68Mannitol_dh/PF01232_23/0_0043_NODE_507_length_7855_cov_144_722779_g405_i034024232